MDAPADKDVAVLESQHDGALRRLCSAAVARPFRPRQRTRRPCCPQWSSFVCRFRPTLEEAPQSKTSGDAVRRSDSDGPSQPRRVGQRVILENHAFLSSPCETAAPVGVIAMVLANAAQDNTMLNIAVVWRRTVHLITCESQRNRSGHEDCAREPSGRVPPNSRIPR